MMDAWDFGGEGTREASSMSSFSVVALPWEDGDEEDKGILNGKTRLKDICL